MRPHSLTEHYSFIFCLLRSWLEIRFVYLFPPNAYKQFGALRNWKIVMLSPPQSPFRSKACQNSVMLSCSLLQICVSGHLQKKWSEYLTLLCSSPCWHHVSLLLVTSLVNSLQLEGDLCHYPLPCIFWVEKKKKEDCSAQCYKNEIFENYFK